MKSTSLLALLLPGAAFATAASGAAQSHSAPMDTVLKTPAPIVLKDGRAPTSNAHLSLEERQAIDDAASNPYSGLVPLDDQGLPIGIDKPFDGELPTMSSRRSAMADHMQLDVGPDGTLWAFGGTYKASFNKGGASYIPFLGSQAPQSYPVHFASPTITIAGESLQVDGSATPSYDNWTAVFERGSVEERYDIRKGEIEQLYVFHDLPGRGEIVLRSKVTSELAATNGAGQLRFDGPSGGVGYSHAIAIDATGARVAVPTTLAGDSIELRVPSSFVESATLPLTIDPIVTTLDVPENATLNDTSPDISYDRVQMRWLIVWEREFSGTDDDIYAEQYSIGGDLIPGTSAYIDVTSAQWRLPTVAYNRASTQHLVVAQREGSPVQIWGRTRESESTTMGPQILISQSSSDCRAPDVGGDPQIIFGTTYYFVVWERYFQLGVDHDIHGRAVAANSTFPGNTILIDNTSDTYDKVPSISRSVGTLSGGIRLFNVTWQRQFDTDDWDIRGAQTDRDGTIVNPSFSINFSSQDDRWPDASTSLDGLGVTGEREWMTVYERRDSDGTEDIWGTSLRGDSVYTSRNVSSMLVDGSAQDQVQPCIDSTGHEFVIGWSQRFMDSITDFDIHAASLYLAGGVPYVSEAPVTLAFSTDFELHVDVCARHSSGLLSDWAGFVWRDYDFPGTNDSDVEGTVYLAPANYGNDIGSNYCDAIPNSTGIEARIHASGSAHAGSEPVSVTAYRLPPNVNGYFIGSSASGNALPASSSGRVCVGNPLSRFNGIGQVMNSGSEGRFTVEINTEAIPLPTGGTRAIGVNETFRFQAWFRDGSTNNLTDATSVFFVL